MIRVILLLLVVVLSGCEMRQTVMFNVQTTTGEVVTFVCPSGRGDTPTHMSGTQCFIYTGGAK